MKRFALFLLALAFALAGCSGDAPLKRYEASFMDVFDTYSQVIVYANSAQSASQSVDRLHEELKTCHALFDIYHEYEGIANLYTLNEEAVRAPVAVDERILELLELSKRLYAETDGRMNIALGGVLALWHEAREQGTANPEAARLPDMDALREAAKHANPDDIVLDREAGTVYFADPQLRLDVGAIAKGYAVERAAALLEREGVAHALLNIGGNARAIGTRPDGTPWSVGIRNPDAESDTQLAQTAALDGLSLVTSGDYLRYYTVDGVRCHHIIDPDTLMPAAYFHSVSVATKDSALADALSTALFCLSVEDGLALLSRYENAEAYWIELDGTQRFSDGFAELLIKEAAA